MFTKRTRVHIVSYTCTETLNFEHHNLLSFSENLKYGQKESHIGFQDLQYWFRAKVGLNNGSIYKVGQRAVKAEFKLSSKEGFNRSLTDFGPRS